MDEREKVLCELRTLSEIVSSHKLSTIDLLKIDVEGAEELLLDGLATEDWRKVQSVIVEIHDIDDRLERLKRRCEQHGLKHQIVSYETLFDRVQFGV